MVFTDYHNAIKLRGVHPTRPQLRYAIQSELLPRPRMNGAGHFEFEATDVDAAVALFKAKEAVKTISRNSPRATATV